GALPGMTYRYAETYDDTQPALVVQVGAQELRVSYGADTWMASCSTGQVSLPDILVKFMEEHGFTESRS
ncbi:hypothetical protein J8J32_21615, partial [Mycobacterium tuberculosis]|uniref:hypothetical protein n=1 Tax=Mycobacterium tuberculosis TaxID=1773 RepID=UPI001ADF8FA5